MLETVNDFGRKVTALFEVDKYCTFAPPEETLGVIDTSAARDGSRGIAFLCDEIRTNFDGIIHRAGYKQICSVTIVRSFETTFDDELQIDSPTGCIRITDCSLNKFFLRQLINSLCRIYYTMREDACSAMYDACSSRAMEHFAGDIPSVDVSLADSESVAVSVVQEETPAPVEIPDGKIEWLSKENDNEGIADDTDFSANDLPEDMTREEMIAFLKDGINEINSSSDDDDEIDGFESVSDEELMAEPAPVAAEAEPEATSQTEGTAPVTVNEVAETEQLPESEVAAIDPSVALGLTIEPESDDIYIKASRRLREFCVEGRLEMPQIENAVKENMVSTAESYSALIAENDIPDAIAQRVDDLKNATDRLAEYFAMGEDIAARVMFFMLYQMLSYSDRIAEQEDTKERINDFFRRYGPAGLALSLIDSGI